MKITYYIRVAASGLSTALFAGLALFSNEPTLTIAYGLLALTWMTFFVEQTEKGPRV